MPGDTGVRPENSIAPNLLDRQFAATAPNQRWVADFTYIWTDEGWLYMAIWRTGRARELLVHSDQGSQYTSERYQALLSEFGITCSMSRRGDVWDNSAMESFFSSLKTERTTRSRYRTRHQARADVFAYVERFYNVRRRHSTIGYVSPAEFESMAATV